VNWTEHRFPEVTVAAIAADLPASPSKKPNWDRAGPAKATGVVPPKTSPTSSSPAAEHPFAPANTSVDRTHGDFLLTLARGFGSSETSMGVGTNVIDGILR
jgi:hypothetical protein